MQLTEFCTKIVFQDELILLTGLLENDLLRQYALYNKEILLVCCLYD